jgi:ATP/maltotriose-dependent transcriptional regulator MalT
MKTNQIAIVPPSNEVSDASSRQGTCPGSLACFIRVNTIGFGHLVCQHVRVMAKTAAHRTRDRPGGGGSLVPEALPPLAEAKLAVPGVRRGMVDRPRIRGALNAAGDAALTLVAAPAGYGKTTAVRAWCESLDAALAWVMLDADDNDPVRLWTYIATAADRVRQGLGRGALQRLPVPGGPIEVAIDELMNGLAAFGAPLVLVLDDLETVTDPECLASIDYALEHMPATVRAVFITRTEPAIPLARRRAAGQLAEVRARELAFTAAEAQVLLAEHTHLDLGQQELEMLVERTEGWPAALVLAGLWLRTVDNPRRAVREFGGDHHFVAEYLSNEVLASLDDDLGSFLLGASVLGRFTADLCDGVLDRSDSASTLDELERSNLFILRLERAGWFRIHSLFAAFAAARLASTDSGAANRIHRRAAAWLRSQGLPIEAIEQAAAAEDHEFVAELLVDYHAALIDSGATKTLLRWVHTLPDEHIVAHPKLAVAAASSVMLVGQSANERRRFLQLTDRALAGKPEGSDPYVESVAWLVRAATIDGGVGQAVLNGRRAVELSHGLDEVFPGALAAYARALYFAGDLDEAWAASFRALEYSHAVPALVVAHSTLALVAVERGRLASGGGHVEKAKALVGGIGASRSWLGASASSALGVVLASEGKLADAERELALAEHFYRDEVATLHHAWLLVLLADVRDRRGRLDDAEAAMRAAREELAELADSGRIPALADQVERELETARARADRGDLLESPTQAELAVLRLLATDLSNRQIGERLFLSPNTIRSHTRAIYRKLGVHAREDAVARAAALGLLEQSESSG